MHTIQTIIQILIKSCSKHIEEAERLDHDKDVMVRKVKGAILFKERKWKQLKDLLVSKQEPFLKVIADDLLLTMQDEERLISLLRRANAIDDQARDLSMRMLHELKTIQPLILELQKSTRMQIDAWDIDDFMRNYDAERHILEQINGRIQDITSFAEHQGLANPEPELVSSAHNLYGMAPSLRKIALALLFCASVLSAESLGLLQKAAADKFVAEGHRTVSIGSGGSLKAEPPSIPVPDVPSAPLGYEYWKTVKAVVTAYNPTGKGLMAGKGKALGLTSTRKNAFIFDGAAVDPRLIPYGTKLFIPGVGLKIADDTGGKILRNGRRGVFHIDVRMKKYMDAKRFGSKVILINLYRKL